MRYGESFSFSENDSRYIILNRVRPHSAVLEFGCANGNMTRYMARQLDCRVYIVENDREAFGQAIKYAADGLCDDIQKLAWADRFHCTFDYVIFADVLEHLRNPQEVLRQARKVLKEGGSALVSVPNLAHNDILINLYQDEFHYTATGLLDDTHIHFFTENSLEECCNAAGYTVVRRMHTAIPTGATEQKAHLASIGLKNMLHGRENGTVYQHIVELKASAFCMENGIKEAERHREPPRLAGRVYFDYGDGYREEASEALESTRNGDGEYVCHYEMDVPQGLKNVRFHPVREQGCIIREFEAGSDGKRLEYSCPFSLCTQHGLFLYSNDPWVEVTGIEGAMDKVSLKAIFVAEGTDPYLQDIKAMGEEQGRKLAEMGRQAAERDGKLAEMEGQVAGYKRQLSSLRDQLDFQQDQYEEACRHAEETRGRLAEAEGRARIWEQSYQDILNSHSWRLSRPIRIPGRIRERIAAQKGAGKGKGIKGIEDIKGRKGINAGDAKGVEEKVLFSILMPVYNGKPQWLEKAVRSIERQTYGNWELCIVDDASTERATVDYLSQIGSPKIKVRFSVENGGISSATNAAAKMAEGTYLLLMDQDDEVTPDALAEFAACILETGADIIYSDQDIVDERGSHSCPLYKPDWSPDLLRSQMYIGHLCGFKKSLFCEVGGFQKEFDGSQDYDLLLRMTERCGNVAHIPKVLYSWRALPSSTSVNPDAKPYAQYAGLRAVQAHLGRVYGEGAAQARETENLFVYDTVYKVKEDVRISIIIPTKDHPEDLRAAVGSIFGKSSYRNFEVLIMNNNSTCQETYAYFKEVQSAHSNVRVVDALYEFNWSRLNNHGMREASGDVYIFLNNDVEVLTSDWMERLAGRALRKGTCAAGAMLLYGDGTVQHAGVVVGLGGWADHVYKGSAPAHCGTPFISPKAARNVTAVTGACMAVSRQVVEEIGGFDERYIICGSDVELCIRGYRKGYVNVYDPEVRLIHYESKSRDSYIPEVDFKLSAKAYESFHGEDPYYNSNLDYTSLTPKVRQVSPSQGTCQPTAQLQAHVAEVTPIRFRKVDYPRPRWNLLLPSLNPKDVFGGIATAYRFFQKLVEMTGYDCRIILTDAALTVEAAAKYGAEYRYVRSEKESRARRQIVPFSNRAGKTLPVSGQDHFVFTAWWTAYCIQEEYRNWQGQGLRAHPFVYLIQDYEPGFYAWSSRHMMADATYRAPFAQVAVFNSQLLKDYFDLWGYKFHASFVFNPVLNEGLKKALDGLGESAVKKKQVLIYGRPNTQRNAFELAVEGLRRWVATYGDVSGWEVLSAGEPHGDVDLGNGKWLRSVGKLSIGEYARVLAETYAGVSLMVSPHPSYPPLEMSVFGVRVITNKYANKDLGTFNSNIISLDAASPASIAAELARVCGEYDGKGMVMRDRNREYCDGGDEFPFMGEMLGHI